MVVGVLVGEVPVGPALEGSGVGTLSFPMVMTGHEGKGGGGGRCQDRDLRPRVGTNSAEPGAP